MKKSGWYLRGQSGYPERLAELKRSPTGIWRVGAWTPRQNALAIVGARAASQAAMRFAREIAALAATKGWDVISGGAFGVDAAAHDGALGQHGQTVAVLGCGVDVDYPARHAPLFAQIKMSGALISEFPLGTPPRSKQFPPRNRLIAALADAVIVVEAGAKSGALHTATAARELGRHLYARPGSPGCDDLIERGATSLRDPQSIFGPVEPAVIKVSMTAERVFSVLGQQSGTLTELASRSGLSVGECAEVLFELETCGKAFRTFGGNYKAHG